MTSILQIAVSNLLLATLLAVPALAVGRLWKNQQVAHLMWVIVLAKFVTPPLWNVPIPLAAMVGTTPTNAPQPEKWWKREHFANQVAPVSRPMSESVKSVGDIKAEPVGSPISNSATAGNATLKSESSGFTPEMSPPTWFTILSQLWLFSSSLCCIVVFARVVQFHRLARRGEAADALLVQRVTRLAERLRLSRIPDVQLLDAEIAPMVWPLTWRKQVLLPKRLAGDLTPAQLDTVIVHELAHLVRHDELVRLLETVVTCLFWWNPLVWLARRELHVAEESCCDALVVCSLPESRQQYGEALLRVAEMLTFGPSLPELASAFGKERFLKRRIEMILNHKFRRSASWQAKLVLLVLSLAVLPLAATAMSQEPIPSAEAPTADAPTAEDGGDPQPSPNATDLRETIRTAEKMIRPLYSLAGDDTRITSTEQLRIMDVDTWIRFWLRHTGQPGTPADFSVTRPSGAPRIDFEQCMVLAVTESPGQLNAGIRVVAITETDRQLTVNYENMPYQAPEGVLAPGNSFGILVIPRSLKEVIFRHNVQEARSRILGEPPVWKEVRRIAALDALPSVTVPQLDTGPHGGHFSQSLRIAVDPKIGNGLQPAPETGNPAPPISTVARHAINIGFAHDPGPGNYDGIVGRPNDVWNFVDIGTTAVDYLRSADGLGTPMTLKVSRHDGEWGIEGVSGVFHGYIYHNCQCIDLNATITGLPPGRYMAYVYAHGDAPNQNAEVELAVGPESYGRKSTLNDGTWKFRSKTVEEGVQYVSFQFASAAGQPVTITAHRAGSGYSMLNAIQIAPMDAVK